jgi:hypothetical protein
MSSFFGVILGIGIVFALPFWLVRYVGSKTGPTDDSQLVGLKGWLALMVALLGIVSPLYLIGSVYSGFEDLERSYPLVSRLPQYLSYKSSAIFLSVVVVLVQTYSAWRLLVSRDYSAVLFLKRFLVASPFLAFCYPLLGSFYFSDIGSDQWVESIGRFVGQSVVNAVWYLYLSKSKRVSATYCKLGGPVLSFSAFQEDRAAPRVFRDTLSVSDKENSSELVRHQTLDIKNSSPNNIGSPLRVNDKSFSGISNLERVYGAGQIDQVKWARYLESSDFDEVQACAKYWRS